jgi:repressor LexA
VDYYSIYENIRNSRGWTNYRVSKESGVPQSTLSDWKRKGSMPDISTLTRIADALDVLLPELLGYEVKERRA